MAIRIKALVVVVGWLTGSLAGWGHAVGQDPIDVGNEVQPFVDRHLIEEMSESVALVMHEPQAAEVALVTGESWEGNTSAYYTILQDGDTYRMYYRGSHYDTETRQATHAEVTCYAESKDGIHWAKPSLGLCEFDGSTDNNIIWDGIGTHCFVPFIDRRPDCPPEQKYKAVARGRPLGSAGLYPYHSADGIHWELTVERPVITDGAFDSQNLAFWDPNRNQYVAYFRTFRNGVRSITTCTSDDFIEWTEPRDLTYEDSPAEHLYTNAIRPYPGTTNLWIGFPTRYTPANSSVEPILMTSRDGLHFRRWSDALIPQSAPEDRDGNRSNYMAHGLVELPDEESTWSVYATEAYYTGPDSRIRRFQIRKHGFVSLTCGGETGEVVTKPIRFDGTALKLNYDAAGGGTVRVAILNEAGTEELEGFELEACDAMSGDELDATVTWNSDQDLSELQGRTIRLKFVISQANLYALQFSP